VIEELRKRWREEVWLDHDWKFDRHRQSSPGILDGMWIAHDPLFAPYGAYLKPTNKCTYPAAAREKIAADLAHDVGVPVAPVILTDAPPSFGSPQKEACVSLVTHPKQPPYSWALDGSMPLTPVVELMCSRAKEACSKIVVFDMWIGNYDRNTLDNIVYGEDEDAPERAAFCAIDHSSSMGGCGRVSTWRGDGWSDMQRLPFPPVLESHLDKATMLSAAIAIHSVLDSEIRHCVERIPERYMSSAIKNETVNGLLGRKQLLRAFVLQFS